MTEYELKNNTLWFDYDKYILTKNKAIAANQEALMYAIPYEAYKKDTVMTDILRLHCAAPDYESGELICGECSHNSIGLKRFYPCETTQIIMKVVR